jgi:DNA-binding protein HU-beta
MGSQRRDAGARPAPIRLRHELLQDGEPSRCFRRILSGRAAASPSRGAAGGRCARGQGRPDMAKRAARPIMVTLKTSGRIRRRGAGLTTEQMAGILTGTVSRIARHLRKADEVRILGLGILQVRRRAAPTGRIEPLARRCRSRRPRRSYLAPPRSLGVPFNA